MIHETAELDADVTIGPGTNVWHHAQIRSGARIGRNCTIGKGVYIGEGVKVGNQVKIQNYACVYGPCTVEDEVFIGPHAVVTNDRWPRSTTELGDTVLDWKREPILICHRASIGTGAIVLPGVTIGREAMIGAGSVVTEDIAACKVAFGSPARVSRDIQSEGVL